MEDDDIIQIQSQNECHLALALIYVVSKLIQQPRVKNA